MIPFILLSVYITGLFATYVYFRVFEPAKDKCEDMTLAIFWPFIVPIGLILLIPDSLTYIGDLIANEVKRLRND